MYWGHIAKEPSMIPSGYEDLLASTALADIATIGPQGEPQVNPVWFSWDDTHVRFSQTKTRQKLHNLQRDPRIALSIVDPANPYRYLEIRGHVVDVEEDPNLDFINSMAKKYLGQDKYPWHRPGDERVVIVVEPERTTQMGG
jgi:PPOX class probable F420-dependent enzyme